MSGQSIPFTDAEINSMILSLPYVPSNPTRCVANFFSILKDYALEYEVVEGENTQTVTILVNKIKVASAQAKTARSAKEKASSAALDVLRSKADLVKLLEEAGSASA